MWPAGYAVGFQGEKFSLVVAGVAAGSHGAAVVRVGASCGQGVCNAQRCASPVHGLCPRPEGLSTAGVPLAGGLLLIFRG